MSTNIDFTTLAFGNYSTSEQNTGFKWIDGKTIYKKTINTGTLPNAAQKTVAHNINNLSFIVAVSGVAKSPTAGAYYTIPSTSTASVQNQVGITITATNINLYTGINRTEFTSSYITLYYTKTS